MHTAAARADAAVPRLGGRGAAQLCRRRSLAAQLPASVDLGRRHFRRPGALPERQQHAGLAAGADAARARAARTERLTTPRAAPGPALRPYPLRLDGPGSFGTLEQIRNNKEAQPARRGRISSCLQRLNDMIEQLRQRLQALQKTAGIEDGPRAPCRSASRRSTTRSAAVWRAARCTRSRRRARPISPRRRALRSELAARGRTRVFWIAEDMALAESGAPYGPGLDVFGLRPERLLTVAAAQRATCCGRWRRRCAAARSTP